MVTPTALEELYTLAKAYDADIVHCEKYFDTNEDLSEVRVKSEEPEKFFVDKPTLETENLVERIQIFTDARYGITPWNKFVRRNLAIEHGIKFPPVSICEDLFWTYELIFYAKKILRVPNVVYFYRRAKNSVMRVNKTVKQYILFWLNPILFGLPSMEDVLSKHDFFRQNPQYLYQILEIYLDSSHPPITYATSDIPPSTFYEMIKQEFGERLGEHAVLISMLYTKLNTLQLTNEKNIQNFNEFAEEANRRIAELEAELERLKS